MPGNKVKVAFLDRDGVINKDTGYTYKIDDFEFTDGCIAGLKALQASGYKIIVVTNQSGIGRGYYSEADYQELTHWYREQLTRQGVKLTDVFYCPHTPEDNCNCRKPAEGLFLQAAERYRIDFSASLMVGDKLSDLQAAQKAGVSRLVLVNPALLKKGVAHHISGDELLEASLTESVEQYPSLFEFSKTL